MNKKLRLRITNAISSTFNSCKPKTNTTTNPAQVFYLSPSNPKIHDIEFPTPPPPPRPSPSRRLSSVLVPGWEEDMDDLSRARSTPGYLWRKDEKWLAVTTVSNGDGLQMFSRRPKIDCQSNELVHDDDDEDDQFDNVVKLTTRRRREKEMIRRRAQTRGRKSGSKSRNSTSSMASTGTWFSSEEDNEREEVDLYYDDDEGDDTDTLLSSRSFEGDSSRIKQPRAISSGCATAMWSRICGGDEGRVKESFVVVKKSEDPRGDFRRSMAEMVVEKGIYEAEDLEHLLHCFLSLNHKQHHGAIVSAFADIWEALFPQNSPHISSDMHKV